MGIGKHNKARSRIETPYEALRSQPVRQLTGRHATPTWRSLLQHLETFKRLQLCAHYCSIWRHSSMYGSFDRYYDRVCFSPAVCCFLPISNYLFRLRLLHLKVDSKRYGIAAPLARSAAYNVFSQEICEVSLNSIAINKVTFIESNKLLTVVTNRNTRLVMVLELTKMASLRSKLHERTVRFDVIIIHDSPERYQSDLRCLHETSRTNLALRALLVAATSSMVL